MTLLHVKEIECRYDHQVAISNLSFHANTGSIIGLLGPSGCGKTTALRAIAGLEPLTSGEIILADKRVSDIGYCMPTEKRHVGMVFQDYALFPHLNVMANVCFGIHELPRKEQTRIAEELFELVGLSGYSQRYPHELSGGQQQRVALARAMAPKPQLLLMDEPFSSLDVELRERVSIEVREILKEQGITGILVTHDQHEAFAMCDQVGVMNHGQLQQWDTPFNLYHEPCNRFVADFIGQGRFLTGKMLTADTLETEAGIISGNRAFHWPAGTTVDVLLRPDDIVEDAHGPLLGTIVDKGFQGAETLYTLKLSTGSTLLSLLPSHHDHALGSKLKFRIAADHLVVFAHTS